MSKIQVNDLKTTGVELFEDTEGFMEDIKDDELEQVMGGYIASSIISGDSGTIFTGPRTLPHTIVIL